MRTHSTTQDTQLADIIQYIETGELRTKGEESPIISTDMHNINCAG